MNGNAFPNVCGDCADDAARTASEEEVLAEGCGHPVATRFIRPCYCEFCAEDRGVCMACGGSMGLSRPSERDVGLTLEEDKPHNGSRSVVAIIILSAVVALAIAIGLGLHQC